MIRVRRDPIWLLLVTMPVLAWLWFAYPDQHSWLQIVLLGWGGLIVLRTVFWVLTLISRPPVPDSAVRELIELCTRSQPDSAWIFVKFRPSVSLEEARWKVGSPSYSEKDRLHGFMTKFEFAAPSRPDVAVFHSSKKGYLMGRVSHIKMLENKYGFWTLNTWYSLRGSIIRNGMSECSLDGGQFFVHGQHIGEVPDV